MLCDITFQSSATSSFCIAYASQETTTRTTTTTTTTTTMSEAADACRARGSWLAAFETEEQKRDIAEFLNRHYGWSYCELSAIR